MKIPTEYGGLGLTMRSYGRALMLIGSVHPTLGALLSAHQSIGVPGAGQAGRHGGAEAAVPAPLRRRARSPRSCSPSPTSGRTRPGWRAPRRPPTDGTAYLLDGVKLWTTNGVVAELLVVMARVPAARRAGAAASRRSSSRATPRGITVERRNAFMGLRGHRERPDPAAPGAGAGREPARQGGRGPQDRADHAQRGPAVDPGDVLGGAASGR